MKVTAADLEASIDEHLGNVAVHHEIETAKETYARAKAFLLQLRAKRPNGAPKRHAEAEAETEEQPRS